MAYARAQASIELISILSVSLLVLGIILATSQSAFEDMQISLSAKMSENSLRMLARNAKNAYESGAGSMQKTNLHIPSTVVPEQSYLADNLINLRLEHKYGIKDIPQPFDVPVRGNISFEPGDYEVYAVSHNGYVYLTYDPSITTDAVIVYLNAEKGKTSSKTIKVRNPGYSESVIKVSIDNPSNVNIDPSWTSAVIEGGEYKELDVSVYSDSSADIKAFMHLMSNSGENETIILNIRVS